MKKYLVITNNEKYYLINPLNIFQKKISKNFVD